MNKKLLLSLLFLNGIVSLMNGSGEPPTKKRKIDETQMLEEELKANPDALFEAIYKKNYNKVIGLIEAGADLSRMDEDDSALTALLGICARDSEENEKIYEIAELMLDKAPQLINIPTPNGWPPLHITVENECVAQENDTKLIQLLIDKGADLNAQAPGYEVDGQTLLHMLITNLQDYPNYQKKVAEFLLEKGANPDMQDAQNGTPLFVATWEKNLDLVKLLLEYGANIEIRDAQGRSPYDVAQGEGWAAGLNELIIAGITAGNNLKRLSQKFDISVQDAQGNTALHKLVKRYLEIQETDAETLKQESLNAVQEIIGRIMSINNTLIDVSNDEGYTPLQLSIAAPRLYEKLLSIIKEPNE